MITPRTRAFTLSATALSAIAFATCLAARADPSPPPPIVVVLYPATSRPSNSLRSSILELRDELRTNPRIEVLEFNPDAPTFILAARDAGLDLGHIASDDDRAGLAHSLGAQLSVTIASGAGAGADGHPTVDATIRAVKASGTQPPGITADNDSVLAAAQVVDEQVMVIDAARNAARSADAGNALPAAAPQISVIPPAAQPEAPAQIPSTTSAVASPASAVSAPPAPRSAPSNVAPLVAASPSVSESSPTDLPSAAPVPNPKPSSIPPPQVVAPASPAPTQQVSTPMPTAPLAPISLLPTQLSADTQSWLGKGDDALSHADTGAAIEDYRQAVDSSPRNAGPRIKLTKAYLAAGDSDLALGELQRAVAIEPGSTDLLNYLNELSTSGDLPGVDTILLQLQAGSHPNDAAALLTLGDTYWNSNHLDLAEQSYTQAAQISGSGAEPYARLARLYAATGRYGECLTALSHSGDRGYPAALRIIKERAETLIGDIDGAVQDFKAGNQTATDFYNTLKVSDGHVSAYAAFISKIKPPAAYKVSYLHRLLAANLLAQMTLDLENYALTGNSQFLDQAHDLEHSAEQELSEANVADKLQQAVSAGN